MHGEWRAGGFNSAERGGTDKNTIILHYIPIISCTLHIRDKPRTSVRVPALPLPTYLFGCICFIKIYIYRTKIYTIVEHSNTTLFIVIVLSVCTVNINRFMIWLFEYRFMGIACFVILLNG